MADESMMTHATFMASTTHLIRDIPWVGALGHVAREHALRMEFRLSFPETELMLNNTRVTLERMRSINTHFADWTSYKNGGERTITFAFSRKADAALFQLIWSGELATSQEAI